MSGIFDLDTDGQAALDEEAQRNPLRLEDLPKAAWAGGAEALKGLLRPSAGAGRSIMMAGAPVAIGIDKAREVGRAVGDAMDFLGRAGQPFGAMHMPDQAPGTSAQDAYFRMVDDLGSRAVDAWTPDPDAMGSAAKALNVGGNVVGSLPQLFGTPTLFLANAALDPSTELVRQGMDAKTAGVVGGINLAANAIGLRLPAAWGSTLATRIGTGAGSNLGLGIAADAASSGALEAAGYGQQAEGYDAGDPYARALDVLMGAAFGYKAHVDAPRLMSQSQRDAVLTTRNNDHLHRQTLPGEPTTPAAAMQHANALSAAIGQVLRGEQVNVADTIRPGDFVLRPEVRPEAPRGAGVSDYGAFLVALESGGKADAKATTSSATGLHQFTSGTWLRTVKGAAPTWAAGLDDAQLLALRTDPAKSAEMERVLRGQNADALARAGVKADGFNLYAAHHFGEVGGVKFAKAAGNTPMSEILSAGQLKANGYLRGLTKDQAIANWTARAQKAGVEVSPARVAFEDPDVTPQRQFTEAMREIGAPEHIVRDYMPRAPRDSVTGFFDARADHVKVQTLERAMRHVADTGEAAHYVSADVANLGGLNAHVGDVAELANVHYREMAQIVERELRKAGADVVPMRTGGDEFGAVVVNVDAATLDAAITRAGSRVAAYAREQGLSEIPNPKRSTEKGVGVHVGAAEIVPGLDAAAILARADSGVNLSKTKATDNVDRSTTRTPGDDAPGGQPGSTARGDGAPDRGVRQAGAGGKARPDLGSGAGRQPAQGDRGKVTAAETPLDAATRLAAEAPDTLLIDGFDADGNPRYRPAAEVLAEIEAERARAANDAQAFPAAADCFIRRGA